MKLLCDRKELLAVVTFLKHFHQYLIGRHFTIQTDCGALTWLQNFKTPEGQLTRWLEKLQDYQFMIVHRPGRKHNADAMPAVWEKLTKLRSISRCNLSYRLNRWIFSP